MDQFGVAPRCADDIALAVSETCANAVLHARQHDQFFLDFELDDDWCSIAVHNEGAWRPPAPNGERDILHTSGRGLALIEALVDDVKVESDHGTGTRVVLRKRLQLDGDPLGDHGSTSNEDALKVLDRVAEREDVTVPQEVAYGNWSNRFDPGRDRAVRRN